MVTSVLNAGVRPHRKASAVKSARDGALTDADFRGCRWIEGDPSPLRCGMFAACPWQRARAGARSIALSSLVKT
jgi:hypothetical protein